MTLTKNLFYGKVTTAPTTAFGNSHRAAMTRTRSSLSSAASSSSSSSLLLPRCRLQQPPTTTILLFILILMCHRSNFHAIETAADVLTDPKFTFPIANVTASVGRDAFLTCVVQDLGSYK
uniref:Ig-like domain-containing protein n=1 Tax=Musca domestica TaxID=7370 RepID=A0A1I8NJ98_MUSDO